MAYVHLLSKPILDADIEQLSFEDAVLKGLAPDNGLFIPEEIPSLPPNWHQDWLDLSFEDLAFQIFSLYISPAEIPPAALQGIIRNSYSTFRVPSITPTITLDGSSRIYLLELFHGPTFAFKDVALQFLGNLLEFFLTRRNKGMTGRDREHLTVIGATSGDTGSAAIYGLKGKKDVSVFIMYPTGKVSPIQEAQMTTVMDENGMSFKTLTLKSCFPLGLQRLDFRDWFADKLIRILQCTVSASMGRSMIVKYTTLFHAS